MSNALTRKKKKMQPVGFTKQELASMQNYARLKTNTDILIEDSYMNIRLIGYQILHDKFGFGQKRIIRVEQTIDEYLNSVSSGGMSTEELQYFMSEKCGIDVKDEANAVPFRERFALTSRKVAAQSMQSAGNYLLASICNYFSLLGVCLKTQFKFSTRQIKEVYGWIKYYINSLSSGYETMTGVASVLYYECKYCDSRYAGRVYEV